MPSPVWDRLPKLFALFAAFAVAAVALTLACYTHPLVDDYRGADPNSDVISLVTHFYRIWTGRWAAMALQSLALGYLPMPAAYPALIICLMGLHLLALAAFISVLLPPEHRRPSTIAFLAFILAAVLFSGMPGPGETLYWYTGAVENLLPLTLICFLVYFLHHLVTAGRFILAFFVLPPLIIFITGLHEIAIFPLAAVLFVGVLSTLHRPGPLRTLWLTLAAAAIVGFLISYLAPGNFARALTYERRPNHLYKAFQAGPRLDIRAIGWILNPRLLALIALVLFAPVFRPAAAWLAAIPRPLRWITPLLLFGVVTVVGWLHGWISGELDPAWRTRAFVYTFVTLASLASALCLRSLFPDFSLSTLAAARLQRVAFLTLAIALLALGNLAIGIDDLRHRVRPWHDAIHARNAYLWQAAREGQSVVLVDPLPTPPKLFISWGDFHPLNKWARKVIARFYGLTEVGLNNGPPIPP